MKEWQISSRLPASSWRHEASHRSRWDPECSHLTSTALQRTAGDRNVRTLHLLERLASVAAQSERAVCLQPNGAVSSPKSRRIRGSGDGTSAGLHPLSSRRFWLLNVLSASFVPKVPISMDRPAAGAAFTWNQPGAASRSYHNTRVTKRRLSQPSHVMSPALYVAHSWEGLATQAESFYNQNAFCPPSVGQC